MPGKHRFRQINRDGLNHFAFARNPLLLPLVVLLMAHVGLSACAPRQDDPPVPDAGVSFQSQAASPWIELEGAENVRQLGGYPTQNGGETRQNVIVRAGELGAMTDADMELLTTEYQLAHIVDLRDEIEVENTPDPAVEGTRYHHLNVWPRTVRARIIDESTVGGQLDPELYRKNYYAAFALEPAAIESYRGMFDILLENEGGGVLIHCTHGKDRTGVGAALILYALGVEWEVTEEEYLLSNTALAGSVDITSLRHYRGVVEDVYGSMENYLKAEMGLTESDLLTLREMYTVP